MSGRGGGDVAEDVVGALEAVAAGSHASNTLAMPPLGWRGRVRFCVVITDAPTHGQHEECGATSTHEDHLHATSAYLESVVKMLAQGRINTMVCTLNKNATRATVSALEAAYKDRLHEVEKLVMPLLVNLLKTSDKEYIYWPDRKDQVEGQIDKLLGYTRD